MIRSLFRFIFRILYRVEVRGLANLPAGSKPGIIVCNHVSSIDGLLLRLFLPGKLHFAVFTSEPGLLGRIASTSALSTDQPDSLRDLISKLSASDERLVIFPEGQPSPTGRLSKIHAVAGVLAEKLGQDCCIPVNIAGPELGRYTRRRHPVGRWRPTTAITVGKPVVQAAPADLDRKMRRRWHELHLRSMLEDVAFAANCDDPALPEFLISSARQFGMGQKVYAEFGPPARELSYRTLLRGCFALGRQLGLEHAARERIGLMLPTSVGAAVTFSAAQFAGVVPVMLNFSTSARDVLSACHTANVRVVYTAQKLLDRLEAARNIVDAIREDGIRVVMLEDVRDSLSLATKLHALAFSFFPSLGVAVTPFNRAKPADPAVVLFTSGSEGNPKGVVLTQRNLVANVRQVMARIAAGPGDVLFNALPLFHSTGLIVGAMLPIASGFKAVQYPSPLHYAAIPELIYASGATIIVSTSTFYGQYARAAHANDMFSIEQAYAGGEKMRESVKETWLHKFGKLICEGYGVTETSPVLAVCSQWANELGSVGTLLPGIEMRLEPVEGVDEGGQLHVRGPNIMAGLLISGEQDKLIEPPDGWHNTGDIASVDQFGFLRIIGRTKRFAKVAGEMVPLGRIEEALDNFFGEDPFAVVAIADEKRGEQIILLTVSETASLEQVRAELKQAGASDLWVPRRIAKVDELPLLTTGKPNYPAITKLAIVLQAQAGTSE